MWAPCAHPFFYLNCQIAFEQTRRGNPFCPHCQFSFSICTNFVRFATQSTARLLPIERRAQDTMLVAQISSGPNSPRLSFFPLGTTPSWPTSPRSTPITTLTSSMCASALEEDIGLRPGTHTNAIPAVVAIPLRSSGRGVDYLHAAVALRLRKATALATSRTDKMGALTAVAGSIEAPKRAWDAAASLGFGVVRLLATHATSPV